MSLTHCKYGPLPSPNPDHLPQLIILIFSAGCQTRTTIWTVWRTWMSPTPSQARREPSSRRGLPMSTPPASRRLHSPWPQQLRSWWSPRTSPGCAQPAWWATLTTSWWAPPRTPAAGPVGWRWPCRSRPGQCSGLGHCSSEQDSSWTQRKVGSIPGYSSWPSKDWWLGTKCL